MIVGHKIQQYLTIVPFDYGGHYEVITHRIVVELHATKGWRVVRHDRSLQRVRNRPSWRDRNKVTISTFVRARPKRDRQPIGLTDAAMERAVMRHKVRRVEIQRAKNLAANA